MAKKKQARSKRIAKVKKVNTTRRTEVSQKLAYADSVNDDKRNASLDDKSSSSGVSSGTASHQVVVEAGKEVKAEHPAEVHDHSHRVNKAQDEAKQHSKEYNERFMNRYRQLDALCSKSTHLAGKLRQQQAQLSLLLPDSLPSAAIIRALGKQGSRYKELSELRVATHADNVSSLGLRLDGLKEEQLETFIAELDELIGEFTGRS